IILVCNFVLTQCWRRDCNCVDGNNHGKRARKRGEETEKSSFRLIYPRAPVTPVVLLSPTQSKSDSDRPFVPLFPSFPYFLLIVSLAFNFQRVSTDSCELSRSRSEY